ncbi:ParB/RepB/Spo0J family partition protein [candidate division KSB1 bacterium]|jgi:ParB family chromosome partitioning protein|nr:ParB/RepB/Spo0J family partition protein [candidate division KSB1 bacterium]
MANKKALGRGLSALLPDISTEENAKGKIETVQVARVSPNPFQPREKFDPATLEELKNSIAEKGVIQPVTVRQVEDGFQLIAGERRLRAVRDLGIETIPAYILQIDSDEDMLELAIIENIHREDLNPIDVANGYRRLIEECELTQEQVAEKVGKDRTTITNFLRLLKLPRRIQESLQEQELSMGHARALLALESAEQQLDIWKNILQKKLSVRKVEELVRTQSTKPKAKPEVPDKKAYYFEDVENRLRQKLMTRVKVKPRANGGGVVEVEFFDDDELERLLSLLGD